MKIFHIYTDASSKDTSMFPQGIKKTTKVGVVDSHIVDIYYNRKEKFIDSHLAERQTIMESIDYVKSKYNGQKIIVHTDFFNMKFHKKTKRYLQNNNITILYVKGHCPNRKGLKYKFNCLADWISRNGINTWRNYYYRHLLK
jgi:hypothetical protein